MIFKYATAPSIKIRFYHRGVYANGKAEIKRQAIRVLKIFVI